MLHVLYRAESVGEASPDPKHIADDITTHAGLYTRIGSSKGKPQSTIKQPPHMQVIEAFAEHKKLPKEMRRRIHSYFDYVASNRKDQAADQALIESLSPQLQIDVRLYIYEDMLKKVRPHQ